MAIVYKVDVLKELKDAGFPTTRLRKEKLLGESVIQSLRKGEGISFSSLDRVCFLLQKSPGDILAYAEGEAPILRRTPQEEFIYLWEIWSENDRDSGKPFNPQDYKQYLPVPNSWRSPMRR